jgi:phage nucleotide-binding protein
MSITVHKPEELQYLKFLAFGPPGSGKTSLIGTAENLLLLDVEGGTMSLRGQDIDVFTINTWQDAQDALHHLRFEPHTYKAVALDSVTALQEVAGEVAGLRAAIEANEDPRRAYGDVGVRIRHYITMLSQLKMHVLFTAQLREREGMDIEKGQFPLVPDVTPSIYKTLLALPDVVARTMLTQVGAQPTDVEHRLVFGPETSSPVKQRDLGLPAYAKGLTIPKLIELAKEGS